MADQNRKWMLSPEEADDRFMNPFLSDDDRKVRIDMYEYVTKGAGSYITPDMFPFVQRFFEQKRFTFDDLHRRSVDHLSLREAQNHPVFGA